MVKGAVERGIPLEGGGGGGGFGVSQTWVHGEENVKMCSLPSALVWDLLG